MLCFCVFRKTPDRRTDPDRNVSVARKLIFSSDEDGPRRKKGQLDMRFKVNRARFLGKALNKDGCLDKRTREYKDYVAKMKLNPSESNPRVKIPLTKHGKPDMRFSVNKQIFKRPELVNQKSSRSTGKEINFYSFLEDNTLADLEPFDRCLTGNILTLESVHGGHFVFPLPHSPEKLGFAHIKSKALKQSKWKLQ